MENDLPVNRKFTVQDIDNLMLGKHHEDDQQEAVNEESNVMNYLGRNEAFEF